MIYLTCFALFFGSVFGACPALPSRVVDCGKYEQQGWRRECGTMCQGDSWFSKDNVSNPNQRVNAQQICRDQGYTGADSGRFGGNWGLQCRHPGWHGNHHNRAGGALTNLGYTVTWKCTGTRSCDAGAQCSSNSHVGQYYINSCEEKCVCENNNGNFAHKCYREREEFSTMPCYRRDRFLNAYKAITTPGHQHYRKMQDLIQLHADGFPRGIHGTQFFLPWHRWYMRQVEDLLRTVDCRITMPWWRWSKKSATWWEGPPFADDNKWLGGDGTASGLCVETGPFKHPWRLERLNSRETSTCLRRRFSKWSFPTLTEVTDSFRISHTEFNRFSDRLQFDLHNMPHGLIGGDMQTTESPRDAAFFLHHSYIDRMWDQWQHQSSNHLNAYGSFSKNDRLPYTGSATAYVRDEFVLADKNILYVDVRSNPPRRRRLAQKTPELPPVGNWVVRDGKVFDIHQLEDALMRCDEGEMDKIPQQAFHIPSVEDVAWILENMNLADTIKFVGRLGKVAVEIVKANDKMEDIVDEFADEVSRMLGFDLEVASKILKVCPLAHIYDVEAEECVPDKAQKKNLKTIKKTLMKAEIINGEVWDKNELRSKKEKNAEVPQEVSEDPALDLEEEVGAEEDLETLHLEAPVAP